MLINFGKKSQSKIHERSILYSGADKSVYFVEGVRMGRRGNYLRNFKKNYRNSLFVVLFVRALKLLDIFLGRAAC